MNNSQLGISRGVVAQSAGASLQDVCRTKSDKFEFHSLNNSFIRTIYFALYQFTLLFFLFFRSVGPWGRADKEHQFS